MNYFSLSNFPLENKTIFLRVDFNVPIKDGKVTENLKIKSSLPTIDYLLQKNCKIILATHLGDPKGKYVPELKTDPLAQELQQNLRKSTSSASTRVIKLNSCVGSEIKEKILAGKKNQIFLLENLRFHPQEEQNDPAFAHALASLAQIYVNDAFAVCHRKHASVDAITHFLPSIPGILLEKEIYYLKQALYPRRPAVWIMGGAKLDKVDLLKQALAKADKILIGGALAFAFLRAKRIPVGLSKTDLESVKIAAQILKDKNSRKLVLPQDFVVTEKLTPRSKTKIRKYNEIQSNEIALDLGPETIELFKRNLAQAHTIVWNGPLGYFEYAQFATATREIGRFVSRLTAVSICGGGETAAAMHKFYLNHKLTHLSTGGGAALSFLAGEKLPGIIALQKNYDRLKKKY